MKPLPARARQSPLEPVAPSSETPVAAPAKPPNAPEGQSSMPSPPRSRAWPAPDRPWRRQPGAPLSLLGTPPPEQRAQMQTPARKHRSRPVALRPNRPTARQRRRRGEADLLCRRASQPVPLRQVALWRKSIVRPARYRATRQRSRSRTWKARPRGQTDRLLRRQKCPLPTARCRTRETARDEARSGRGSDASPHQTMPARSAPQSHRSPVTSRASGSASDLRSARAPRSETPKRACRTYTPSPRLQRRSQTVAAPSPLLQTGSSRLPKYPGARRCCHWP